jgi:L-ascorbate metabolism protein UlaG (beta-lactamase superfamily)
MEVNMEEKIFWLGHSSVMIKSGKVIYIDPWKLKGSPEKADLVLISHSHGDHLSPADVAKVSKEGTVVVCPADCSGFKAVVLTVRPGDKVQANGIPVEAVPSYNTNKAFHPKANNWVGFIVTVDGKRIYYCGDTDFIPEMKQIRADIVIVPVGGTYTMTAEEAANAVNAIKPELAIPIHYGDIVGSVKDAEKFAKLSSVPVKIKKQV